MEDYAGKLLKKKMNLKTCKDVKIVISQKIEEKQKIKRSGTKYMNLINQYYEEHYDHNTLQEYQQILLELAFSQEDKRFEVENPQWMTEIWKKITALLLYYHTKNPHLSSVFALWNSLFQNDPIVKQKMTREEREQNNSVQIVKKTIKKPKPSENNLSTIKSNYILSNRKTEINIYREKDSNIDTPRKNDLQDEIDIIPQPNLLNCDFLNNDDNLLFPYNSKQSQDYIENQNADNFYCFKKHGFQQDQSLVEQKNQITTNNINYSLPDYYEQNYFCSYVDSLIYCEDQQYQKQYLSLEDVQNEQSYYYSNQLFY